MATLSAHKGIEVIYRNSHGYRFALCNDGRVLVYTSGHWLVSGYGPETIRTSAARGDLHIDPADNDTITATNQAIQQRDAAKVQRRTHPA
jgi:hypothetical protein